MAARPRGIQRTILTRLLTIIVVPLLALGVAGFFVLRELADDTDRRVAERRDQLAVEVVGDELSASATEIHAELVRYLDERVADARTWATTPTVTAAAVEGGVTADALGLVDTSTSSLESQFSVTRRLPGAGAAGRYLVDEIDRSPFFARASFTNEYGHNVAASSTPEDFVQSDEDWWQQAWDAGTDIGPVEYSDSEGVFSTDLAVRIDDPVTVEPIGVLEAALDVGILLEVADRHARAGGFEVTILDDAGRVLADTATSYAPDLVLMGMTTIDPQVAVLHESALAASEGHSLGSEAVYGYSGTTSGATGPGWVVIVEQPREVAFASIDGILELGDDVRESTDRLSVGLALALGAITLVLIVLCVLVVRRFVRRVRPSPGAEPPAPVVAAPVPAVPEPAIAPEPAVTPAPVPAPLAPVVATPAIPGFMEQAVLAMGRRDRTLLRRQAEFVDELQQRTSDTGSRAILGRLDEVAVRLQRNAENLLVLAGEAWPPNDDEPVAVDEVIATGAAVLDDRSRITTGALDPVVIIADAAADTAHLLSELLDNALAFSPPESPVDVDGRLTPDGYVVSIADQGIGIAELGLQTANHRLRRPLDVERSPENRLGLFVIGRLAARHEITVELTAREVGLVAEVTLPLDLVDAPPMDTFAMANPTPTVAMTADPAPSARTDPAVLADLPVPDRSAPSAEPGAPTPEPTAEPVTTPEAVTRPEPVTRPEAVAMPEAATTPEPPTPPEPTAEPPRSSVWPDSFSPVEDAPTPPVQSPPMIDRSD